MPPLTKPTTNPAKLPTDGNLTPAPAALLWDYAQIEDEAPVEIITAAAGRIKTVFKRTLENIIEIGKLLNVVRENIPHGHWGDWLDTELGLSASTACNYLNTYEHRDDFRNIDNWSAGAAFLLAGPSVDANAIESANVIAERGERVTRAAAADIISDTSQPAVSSITLDTPPAEPLGTDPAHDPAETAPTTTGAAPAYSPFRHDTQTIDRERSANQTDESKRVRTFLAAITRATRDCAAIKSGKFFDPLRDHLDNLAECCRQHETPDGLDTAAIKSTIERIQNG